MGHRTAASLVLIVSLCAAVHAGYAATARFIASAHPETATVSSAIFAAAFVLIAVLHRSSFAERRRPAFWSNGDAE